MGISHEHDMLLVGDFVMGISHEHDMLLVGDFVMGISHEHDMLLVGDFNALISHEHRLCGYLDFVCVCIGTTTTVPHSKVKIFKSLISTPLGQKWFVLACVYAVGRSVDGPCRIRDTTEQYRSQREAEINGPVGEMRSRSKRIGLSCDFNDKLNTHCIICAANWAAST
jgi:hypothetical protein